MRATYERATKNHLTLLDLVADLVQISRARHGKKIIVQYFFFITALSTCENCLRFYVENVCDSFDSLSFTFPFTTF